MSDDEQKEITAIFRASLKASLRLNMFLACIAIAVLGAYLENMRRDMKEIRISDVRIEKSITKLEANHDSLKANFINFKEDITGRVGKLEDRRH